MGLYTPVLLGIVSVATFLLVSLIYYFFITYSARLFAWRVRNWTPDEHQKKNGTPSMGGIIIIIFTTFALGYASVFNVYLRILLFCLASFGCIGFFDDYAKLTQTEGISARTKFLLQVCAAFLCAFCIYYTLPAARTIMLPFSTISYHIGLLFIPWAMFLLVGVSNAVNLTDGLDGLAAMSVLINVAAYAVLTGLGMGIYHDPAVSAAILSFGAVFGGALASFLWYNVYPAQVMMGDIGALSFGAVLACITLLLRSELLLALTGIVFVAETVSVMLQVAWFKRFKTRIFKRAPLHHHFELLGWAEPKVTARFTMVTLVMNLLVVLWSMR